MTQIKIRVHVFISGKVQGVFFRASIRRFALALGVFGWVRNLRDGRVEAVFEGEKMKIDKMIEFCRKGPLRSEVTELKTVQEQYSDTFDSFEIRYR